MIYTESRDLLSLNCRIVELILINPERYKTIVVTTVSKFNSVSDYENNYNPNANEDKTQSHNSQIRPHGKKSHKNKHNSSDNLKKVEGKDNDNFNNVSPSNVGPSSGVREPINRNFDRKYEENINLPLKENTNSGARSNLNYNNKNSNPINQPPYNDLNTRDKQNNHSRNPRKINFKV